MTDSAGSVQDSGKVDVMHVTEACGGGVRRHLNLIVPALEKHGVRCGLCGFGNRYENEFLEEIQVYERSGYPTDFIGFNPKHVFSLVAYACHLRKLIRAWQPSVIHAHSTWAGLVCRAVKGALPSARLVYSPHAFALHPSLPSWVRLTVRELERWGADRTDAYAFVGRSEIQDANRIKLPPKKFHLIENGLPEDYTTHVCPRAKAREFLRISPDARVAVIPCRLVQQKGLEQVICAMTLLRQDYPDVQFMFCGTGPDHEKLRNMAMDMGVGENARFIGAVDKLSTFLNAFDLAILPSRYEGLSYVLLECLAAGIPLVVSDIMANIPRPELRDILNVFSLGDCRQQAAAIRNCLDHPEEARRRAAHGAEFMKSNFTLELQIAKLVNLYKMLE